MEETRTSGPGAQRTPWEEDPVLRILLRTMEGAATGPSRSAASATEVGRTPEQAASRTVAGREATVSRTPAAGTGASVEGALASSDAARSQSVRQLVGSLPSLSFDRSVLPQGISTRVNKTEGVDMPTNRISQSIKVWDTGWVTLYGDASAPGVAMSQADYLDAAAHSILTLRVSMPGLSGTNLEIQHSSKIDGPWKVIGNALNAATTTMIVLSGEGGDRAFSRFLRWNIGTEGPPATWQACFRLEAFVQA
jgi:hypothetical protein